jgi:hypothetical protein
MFDPQRDPNGRRYCAVFVLRRSTLDLEVSGAHGTVIGTLGLTLRINRCGTAEESSLLPLTIPCQPSVDDLTAFQPSTRRALDECP